MSSSPIGMRQKITPVQFWAALAAMVLSVVAAFVVLASVAGKHGGCPSVSQVSRPAAASCFAASQAQASTGVVG